MKVPKKLKLELVDNAHEWRRWWSMRWIILSAFFSAVIVMYQTLPTDWLPYLPVDAKRWLAVGALVTAGLAAVSRVVQQKPKENP